MVQHSHTENTFCVFELSFGECGRKNIYIFTSFLMYDQEKPVSIPQQILKRKKESKIFINGI